MDALRLTPLPDGFDVHLGSRHLIAHRRAMPFMQLGRGHARMDMHRGNFDIADHIAKRAPLPFATVIPDNGGWRVTLARQPGGADATLHIQGASIAFAVPDPAWNRVFLDLLAGADEHVWGCGEQMSYLDLRGRRFPLWTSEPGVGRDKTTAITQQADAEGRAGGDYYTTNYPQPTFLSSRRYAAHLDTTAYCAFDFTDPARHRLEAWAMPDRLEFFAAPDLLSLVCALSDRFSRPAPVPDWALGGAVIGLKDGANSFARLQRLQDAGVVVAALWCEDWAGVRQTSFGTRLFWDWQWNPSRYPDLPARIASLGVRFLGYCNPYLCNDGALFPVAEARGYLARAADGSTYLVDFGEFEAGVLDFTNPAAANWFAHEVIGRNMLGIGMSGWMADFGEYLPVDVQLHNRADARLMHNAWPTLWAEVNARAIAGAGREGDATFFMRAGWTGTQAQCPLLWAGDQCVDWSRHDGLQTAICAALSSGLVGNTAHHSDIGGYTSLFGLRRTPELIARWAEMAAFTPVMRTHEGNRPAENLQVDSGIGDGGAITAHFARMTRIHAHLLPYTRSVMADARCGVPAQRPLFLHFEADRRTHAIQDSYLYGPDLLVAPVHQPGAAAWTTYLPHGADWVHLWSAARHPGGAGVTVDAPLGQPPVFWRDGSAFAPLFQEVAGLA